jgi:hypothetical protein
MPGNSFQVFGPSFPSAGEPCTEELFLQNTSIFISIFVDCFIRRVYFHTTAQYSFSFHLLPLATIAFHIEGFNTCV